MWRQILQAIDTWMLGHLDALVLGLIATLLTVYGTSLNGLFRRWTQGLHFLIRYLLFVVLCAFGYSFLTNFLMVQSKEMLAQVPSLYRVGGILGAYLLLAFLVRREREV
jgi:hypothetical protein